jgi:hypothetical protein
VVDVVTEQVDSTWGARNDYVSFCAVGIDERIYCLDQELSARLLDVLVVPVQIFQAGLYLRVVSIKILFPLCGTS